MDRSAASALMSILGLVMSTIATAGDLRAHGSRGSLGTLALGALGGVYGDIGTSPLYTMKTALDRGGGATPEVAIGMLSLILGAAFVTARSNSSSGAVGPLCGYPGLRQWPSITTS